MKVNTLVKVITLRTYDKKDANKVATGETGVMINLLTDYEPDTLNGEVISPFVGKDYKGSFDFSDIKQFEEVKVVLNVPSRAGGMYTLIDLQKIKK